MKKILYSLLFLVLGISCESQFKSEAEQFEADVAEIKKYITAKNLKATETPEGVFVVIDSLGSGDKFVVLSNRVTAKYKGFLTDDTEFETGTITDRNLSDFIRGWQIGFQKFKKGGKGKIIIPSKYAYGSRGAGGIPPNSVLIFNVEIIDIQ